MKHILAFLSLIAVAIPAFAQDNTIKSFEVFSYAGTPSSGTSEVDTVTIGGTPTAGSFTITVAGGRTTGAIAWSATNSVLLANVDAALEALNVVGTGGVVTADSSLTAGIGAFTLTFAGKNAKMDFPALSVTSSLTGSSPTLAVATTTAGVEATFRQAPSGTLLVNTTAPSLYQNTSTTAYSPSWVPAPNRLTTGTPDSLAAGSVVVSGSNVKFYLTGSTGLAISGTIVAPF